MTKPLLVGEINPLSKDSRYDLYPGPPGSAGARLCTLFGLTAGQYLRTFDRINLCRDRWDPVVASIAARLIDLRRPAVILLGKKVAAAFGFRYAGEFQKVGVVSGKRGGIVYCVPHPSGRCRAWNNPDNVRKLRRLLSPFIREAKNKNG